MKFRIFEESNLTTGNPYAYLDIPLSELMSQEKETKVYDLKGEGRGSSPKLNLALQFIHSKVKYLESVIGKLDYYIERLNEDATEYENDLNALYEPFPSFFNMYSKKDEPNKSFQQSFQQFTPTQEQKSAIKGGFVKSALFSDEQVEMDKVQLIFIGIILFFAVFVCFARASFLDVRVRLMFRSFYSEFMSICFIGILLPRTNCRFS